MPGVPGAPSSTCWRTATAASPSSATWAGSTSAERYEAYRSTLLDHGLQPDPELLFLAPNNLENGGMVAAQALLAAGLHSTAVFAATDLDAVGTMKVLQAAGLSCGRTRLCRF